VCIALGVYSRVLSMYSYDYFLKSKKAEVLFRLKFSVTSVCYVLFTMQLFM
jgi:hypothetical protein